MPTRDAPPPAPGHRWALDVFLAGLAEARDAEEAAQRLAEHAARIAPGTAARVFVLGDGDRCSVCPRVKECPTRDRCLHLAGEIGAFAQPPGHAARVPRSVPGWAEALGSARLVRRSPAPSELAAPGTGGGPTEAWLLPLRAGGETLGVAAVRPPAVPPEGLADAVAEAAFLAAAAVRSSSARAEEDRRFQQLRLVHQLGVKVLWILDPELLLRQAVVDVQSHFGFRHVSLFLHEPAEHRLVLKAQASQYPSPEVGVSTIPETQGVVGRVLRTGRTVRVDDVSREADYASWWPDTKSEVAVPVRIGGVVEAVLNVESDVAGAFREADVVVLETAAHQVAIALENARLFARVKQREEEYRALVESAPIAVLSVAADGRIAYANPAIGDLTGRDHHDVVARGTALADLAEAEDRPAIADALEAAARGEPARGVEFRAVHADGRHRFAAAEFQPMRVDGSSGSEILVLVRNTTREKELQTRLQQAERLRAMGEMVSGVAHELNNPLSGILGFAQLCLQEPPEKWSKADMSKIEANARRCKRIVENLLAFSRQARLERSPASLNAIVDSVISLNEYPFRLDGVEMVRDLDARVPGLPLDVGRWQQVFVNLAQNAREAMVDAKSPSRRIVFRTRMRGDHVEVRVEDTGPGIPESVMPRVFDPFFTTKEKGTGLGLGLVYGIVADHGGTITAESEPGRGAVFTIRVPCGTDAPASAAADADAPVRPALAGAGMRALVVDDEAVVRDLVSRVLELHGYEVHAAADAADALRRCADAEYHVVVTDLLMPDMDGLALYDRLVQASPRLARRTVFLTGGVPEETRVRDRGLPALLKPFDIRELGRLVNDVARRG